MGEGVGQGGPRCWRVAPRGVTPGHRPRQALYRKSMQALDLLLQSLISKNKSVDELCFILQVRLGLAGGARLGLRPPGVCPSDTKAARSAGVPHAADPGALVKTGVGVSEQPRALRGEGDPGSSPGTAVGREEVPGMVRGLPHSRADVCPQTPWLPSGRRPGLAPGS